MKKITVGHCSHFIKYIAEGEIELIFNTCYAYSILAIIFQLAFNFSLLFCVESMIYAGVYMSLYP